MSLSTQQQELLHEFLDCQMLSENQVEDLVKEIFPSDPEGQTLSKIRDINSVITTYKLNIEKVVDGDDGQVYYVLVNLSDGTISRSSSLRPKSHLEFFKILLDAIVTSDEKSLNETDLVNMAVVNGKRLISIQEAEKLMELWIEGRLLFRDEEDGRITLGISSIAQFRQLIQNKYPAYVKLCIVCATLCLRGPKCVSCSSVLHRSCLTRLRGINSGEVTCCNCQTPL